MKQETTNLINKVYDKLTEGQKEFIILNYLSDETNEDLKERLKED